MSEAATFSKALERTVSSDSSGALPQDRAASISSGKRLGDFHKFLQGMLENQSSLRQTGQDEGAKLTSEAAAANMAFNLPGIGLTGLPNETRLNEETGSAGVELSEEFSWNGASVSYNSRMNSAQGAAVEGNAALESEQNPEGSEFPAALYNSSRIPARLRGRLAGFPGNEIPELRSRLKERLTAARNETPNSTVSNTQTAETPRQQNIIPSEIPVRVDFDRLGADVWVQQVWPLTDSASLFDDKDADVPYREEESLDEFSEIDRTLIDFDREFESRWIAAGVDDSPDSRSDSKSLFTTRGDKIGKSGAAEKEFGTIPNGDRLFSEMVSRMQMNLERGSYRMSLELHPENLGRVTMKVSLAGEHMRARFLVGSEEVQGLMQSRLGELKQALEASGLTVDKVEVALERTDSGIDRLPAGRNSAKVNLRAPGEDFFNVTRAEYFSPVKSDSYKGWVI